MALNVLTWNLGEALGDQRADRAVDFIVRQNTDVAVLTEAYSADKALTDGVEDRLRNEGYSFVALPYASNENLWDRRRLMVIAKKELKPEQRFIDCAGRMAVSSLLKETNGEVNVIGVHVDSRPRNLRRKQTVSLLQNVDSRKPVVVAGKLNDIGLYEAAGFTEVGESPDGLQHIMVRGVAGYNYTPHSITPVSPFTAIEATIERAK